MNICPGLKNKIIKQTNKIERSLEICRSRRPVSRYRYKYVALPWLPWYPPPDNPGSFNHFRHSLVIYCMMWYIYAATENMFAAISDCRKEGVHIKWNACSWLPCVVLVLFLLCYVKNFLSTRWLLTAWHPLTEQYLKCFMVYDLVSAASTSGRSG